MKESIDNTSTFRNTYQPEMWTVREDCIYNAIDSIERGLDYAREALVNHDNALGRTTYKNKTWAETIESDIRQMEFSLKCLRSAPESINNECTPIVPDDSPCLPKS